MRKIIIKDCINYNLLKMWFLFVNFFFRLIFDLKLLNVNLKILIYKDVFFILKFLIDFYKMRWYKNSVFFILYNFSVNNMYI